MAGVLLLRRTKARRASRFSTQYACLNKPHRVRDRTKKRLDEVKGTPENILLFEGTTSNFSAFFGVGMGAWGHGQDGHEAEKPI